jgi:hypothetical protein
MKKNKCSICGQPYQGYGNNASPVVYGGRCCDVCNAYRVIPARLRRLSDYAKPEDDNGFTNKTLGKALTKTFNQLLGN